MTDPHADTTDLRTGPELNLAVLSLLPLVGLWRGTGSGVRPADGVEFRYAQQLRFSHDGRPFLAYDSQTWLVDEDGELIRPAARETGFWRPGAGQDDIEVILALAVGIAQTLTGRAGDAEWELATGQLAIAPTAKTIGGEKRFYAVRDDQLVYAQELALGPGEFRPHLNALLSRVR